MFNYFSMERLFRNIFRGERFFEIKQVLIQHITTKNLTFEISFGHPYRYDNLNTLISGPDENEITDVPSLAGYLQLTKLDWQYKTEPTNYACLGFKKKRCSWPRGKVIIISSITKK